MIVLYINYVCVVAAKSAALATIAAHLIDELDDGLVAAATELIKTVELQPISGIVYFLVIILFFFFLLFFSFFFFFYLNIAFFWQGDIADAKTPSQIIAIIANNMIK